MLVVLTLTIFHPFSVIFQLLTGITLLVYSNLYHFFL
jgi:hypothetical protein